MACLNARVFTPASLRAVETDLPKPSWSTCEKRSVSGLNWRPILPPPCHVSSVTCLCLIPPYGLLLRRGGDRQIGINDNKNDGCAFLFILVGTGHGRGQDRQTEADRTLGDTN